MQSPTLQIRAQTRPTKAIQSSTKLLIWNENSVSRLQKLLAGLKSYLLLISLHPKYRKII